MAGKTDLQGDLQQKIEDLGATIEDLTATIAQLTQDLQSHTVLRHLSLTLGFPISIG